MSDMQGEQDRRPRTAHRHTGRAMKELAEEQGKLSHTYDTMETSGWKNKCSEGHGLRHAGGLARWPCRDKGDD